MESLSKTLIKPTPFRRNKRKSKREKYYHMAPVLANPSVAAMLLCRHPFSLFSVLHFGGMDGILSVPLDTMRISVEKSNLGE
jgi:hypothetical protein